MQPEWMKEHQLHVEEAGRQRIAAERAAGILPPERTIRLDANGRPISL